MFYTNVWSGSNDVKGPNVDKHYSYSIANMKIKGQTLFNKLSFRLDNNDFSGLWAYKYISKHMVSMRYPNYNIRGLFTFRFGNLIIYALPCVAPGAKGIFKEIVGHFKVLGYQREGDSVSKIDIMHEMAMLERLLLRSNTLDVYLLIPINDTAFHNYLSVPNPISIAAKTFIIHCPIMNFMYLFASFKSYRIDLKGTDLDMHTLYCLHMISNFNLMRDMNDKTKMIDPSSFLRIEKKNYDLIIKGDGSYFGIDENSSLKEEPIYTELPSLLLPKITNIFNIDFIKNPEKLQEKFYNNFTNINKQLAENELTKLHESLFVGNGKLNPLVTIFLEFNHILDSNNYRFYDYLPIDKNSIKLDTISTSVELWSFNFCIPIYFYYGEDLVNHLLEGIHYFDSVIGPYSFILSKEMDKFCTDIKFGSKTLEAKNVKIMLISLIQVYFLIVLLASIDSNRVSMDNLDSIELNELTNANASKRIKDILEKLFNASISKSVILDEVFFFDSKIIVDPIVHKVIACTYFIKNGVSEIPEYRKIDFYDIITMSYMMKFYYPQYYFFLQNLIKFNNVLDPYIIGG